MSRVSLPAYYSLPSVIEQVDLAYYPVRIDLESLPIPGTVPPLVYLRAPAAHPIARLIILHGYGDHAGRHSHVMQWMVDHGIDTFAIDFRGHGRSGGKPVAILRWDEYLQDLKAFLATDDLTRTDTPLFVLGHSHGGLIAAAAAMAGMLNHVRGIILVAPYLQLKMPLPLMKRFGAAIASHLLPNIALKSGLNGPMLTRDQAMIEEGKDDPYCRGIATPRWYYETVKVQARITSDAAKFNHPLLMLLPGEDSVADGTVSEAFFNAASSKDKTIRHFPDARHELLREINREDAFGEILIWIKSRLDHV